MTSENQSVHFKDAVSHVARLCAYGGRPNITVKHAHTVFRETQIYPGATAQRIRDYLLMAEVPSSQYKGKEYFHVSKLVSIRDESIFVPERPGFTKNPFSRTTQPRLTLPYPELQEWLEFAVCMIAPVYRFGNRDWISANGLAKIISICGFYNDAPVDDIKTVLMKMNIPCRFENQIIEFDLNSILQKSKGEINEKG